MQSSILIVDDEAIAREALLALLEREDYQLEVAVNGLEGLAKAEQIQPDVILLDVMMQGMDGYEVCRRLRANPLLAEVPIVMITALDDQTSKLNGIEAGADDFISKPFNRAELRARLRTITRLNRFRHLQVERARLMWILEQAQDGYLLLSASDHIQYANRKTRIYLGLPEHEELPIVKFQELVRRHYQLYPEAAWEAWPEPSVDGAGYLVRPETSTAAAFWLLVDILPLADEDEFGRLLHLRDVTEQIITKQDQRKFHSVIEHKFRTPLAHMQLSLEVLLKRLGKYQIVELTNLARNAYEGAARIRDEVNEVLNYLAAPLTNLHGRGCSLGSLLILMPLLSADLGLEKVQVHLPLELQTTCLTLTQTALDTILLELLGNARKFHPTHTPQVEISVTRLNEREILIAVQDDGINLSPRQISWAMTPYLQAEKSFTGEVPGLGLGLPLVSTLAWQVGGKVSLRNHPDQAGIIVELILPIENRNLESHDGSER
jgi:two-component system, cell cycle response regulator